MVVFFFKQKTAYEMRISDWSSDVCSSDLRDEDRALRTLIVDDSVVVRTVIERILNADRRFSVTHKTNSAEHALGYLQDHEVDLILLDIELPGQSGLMALPAILGINPRATVVILSGNCEEGSAAAVAALALGASDILATPGSGRYGEHFPQALTDRLLRLFTGASTPVPQTGRRACRGSRGQYVELSGGRG